MIGIIGGGASGMAAAISAARLGKKVLIIEKNDRIGKKLSATGNGRCNLTNNNAEPNRFFSYTPHTLEKILAGYSVESILDFFDSLGLITYADSEERVYPKSNLATSVLDVLRFQLDELGVQIHTGHSVKSIAKNNETFMVCFQDAKPMHFEKLIIACGSPSAPKLGGTDLGYDLLKSAGHNFTPCYPALAPLETAKELALIRPLKGIRVKCRISAFEGRNLLRAEDGELLFTERGISGIAAMQLSSPIARAKGDVRLVIDLFPDLSFNEVFDLLTKRTGQIPGRSASNWLLGLVHRRIGEALLKRAGISPDTTSGSLTVSQISSLASVIKGFEVRCSGTQSYENSQATSGGARLDEFDALTLESLLCPGLFACGEILDAVGECGGFNLHWAWTTGIKAGLGASK